MPKTSRYQFTDIKKNSKGKSVFKPTIYPKIPLKDDDIFIYPKAMERCEHIAHRVYNDPSLWWIIAQANNIHDGSIYLNSENNVRIPSTPGEILIELKKLNDLF